MAAEFEKTIDEAPKRITQQQLKLCEVACNIAAMQLGTTCEIVLGNKQPTLAKELLGAAIAMKELAALIGTGAIKGVEVIASERQWLINKLGD